MQSNESTEMYLETIHVLHQEKERVQAVDVAKRMGYSKPTISEWMSKLRKLGYVEMDGSNILLTPAGEKIASRVYERHVLLRMLFQSIGVNEETADEDACRVEHYISDETFECLRNHYDAYTAELQD